VIRDLTFAFGEGITGLVAQNGTPIVVSNLASDSRIKVWHNIKKLDHVPDFLKYGSMLSVPMLYQGRVVGVMDFFYPQLNAFDEDDTTLLNALGALVATAVVNADLYEATLELATSDPLTGLLNRRAMERLLDNEIARSQRFSTPLSVLLIDVDNFKAFNDRLGHLLGDEVLKAIANLLKRSVRRVDAVARFGGEEFCVILPQSAHQAAMDVANKLLEMVRSMDFAGASDQPLGRMSISIGVAIYPEHANHFEDGKNVVHDLMRMADAALYEAKKLGRDRAISYSQL
jgi:diguanylate cyclase (GGDEF)-like protein